LRSTGTTSAVFRAYVNSAEAGTIGFLNGGGTYFEVAGTEQMRLTSTGLGIGTSSPGAKLDVIGAGTFRVDGSGSTTPLILRNNNTASTQLVKLGFDSNGAIKASINAAVYGNDYMTFNVGSDTERMRLDSSGNLGLGVTPSGWGGGYKGFQVAATGAVVSNGSNATGIGHNYYFDGSNNRYLTTGAANLFLMINNEHRFYTAASGTAGNAITFTQAMTLDASGRLLIAGTSSSNISGQAQNLLVYSSGTNAIGGYQTSAGGYCFASYAVSNGGTYYHMVFSDAGTSHGSITSNGTTTSYNVTSDQRLKENIVDAPEFGSVIDSLQVRSFDWKSDGNHQRAGFVAQELVTVAPEAVHQPTDTDEMMAVDYSKLVPMLVKEIQSLRQRVAQLEGNQP
jgi:hypothetical protein